MASQNFLPALSIQPPASPIDQYTKALQMKSLLQGQQLQQQQIQQGTQQLADQQALTAAMKGADPTSPTFYDDVAKGVLKNGGSATAALGVQQHALTIKKTVSDIAQSDAKTGSDNLTNYITAHKTVGDALEGTLALPDDQIHDAAIKNINDLVQGKVLDPQTGQLYTQKVAALTDPKQLRTQLDLMAKNSMGAQAVASQQKTAAETSAENAKAALDKANTFLAQNKADVINAWKGNPQGVLSQVDAVVPQSSNLGLNMRTKSQVNFALQNGDVDGAKAAINQAAEQMNSLQKEAYTQGQENIRQDHNRAAMQSNELQRNGLQQLDKLFTDPQHGYTQFLAQASSTKNALADAKDGNELAASLAPLMTVLGVNSFAGIHRVNPQEMSSAGPQVGSIYRRINTALDKAATGSLQPDTAKEMGDLVDGLIAAKHASLIPAAQMVAQNAGLDPTKTTVMTRDGKMDTLANVAAAPAPKAKASGPPAGATHIVPGPDGKNHYTNATGTVDYGVAP